MHPRTPTTVGSAKASRVHLVLLVSLADGPTGRRAGEVQQGEEHRAQRRHPGPSVGQQQRVQLPQGLELHHPPGGHIAHDNDGHDDLVGRKAQNEGHKDEAVQPHQAREGVQEPAHCASRLISPGCWPCTG